MTLNEIKKTVHEANAKWWVNINTGARVVRNKGELIALIHSEISEADDGEFGHLMDDKIKHRSMGEVEMADTAIRIFDYAGGFCYDLNSAAEKFGIFTFSSINEIVPSWTDIPSSTLKYSIINVSRGLIHLHSMTSALLELERKNHPKEEIGLMIVTLIVAISYYCLLKGYDLDGAIKEKMIFNANREDHKHEARLKEGGKKF